MKKVVVTLIKFAIPLIVGIGLFHFLFKNIDMEMVRRSLMGDVNYWWFLPVIVVSTLSHVFRAMRWNLQLRTLGINTPISVLINSIFGTYAINLVFPRLGEVWRTGYIANRQKASIAQVFGSMVSDRLSDTCTVIVLILLTFSLERAAFGEFLDTYPEIKASLQAFITSPITWLVVVGIIALNVVLFRSKTQNPVVNYVRNTVKSLWDGFNSIAKMKGKWKFLLFTVLIWSCYYLQLVFSAQAFTFTSHLGLLPILVLFILSSIGMGVPTNGGLGAWHIAMIFGLSLYGVGQFTPPNFDVQASAFAMLVWGFEMLIYVCLGLYAMVAIAIDDRKRMKSKTTN